MRIQPYWSPMVCWFKRTPRFRHRPKKHQKGEVVTPDAPPLIGSATDASDVSTGGWAVTGKDFIDAAVAVFDFSSTASVSQATLSLPIE